MRNSLKHILGLVSCLVCHVAYGQVAEVPSSAQDDATLHDVCFTGSLQGWAVGDRGSIWQTGDGGATWKWCPSLPGLENVSFRSVCFLTNQVGWVAGGSFVPHSHTDVGVVLHTRDGGKTWTRLADARLPFIQSVQFFDLEGGIAVGERTLRFPSGVMSTIDGGQTWDAVTADESNQWRTAEFYSPTEGILAGDLGRFSLLAAGQVTKGSAVAHGLQGFQGVSIERGDRAWLAGEGALLLTSQNRGVSWSTPEQGLPRELEDFCNFHCVAQHGEHVWVAGSPGSIVWHSPDQGKSWERQMTAETSPLRSIVFVSAEQGIACGDFGRIVVTKDGGRTWQTVRGAFRRLACLEVHSDASQVLPSFVTRWGAESGYRIRILNMTRRDVGIDRHAAHGTLLQLQHAVQLAGGCRADMDWRLPVAIPGLAQDRQRLVEAWSELTDRRLPEVFLGNLVGEIRTWKPSVILLDEPQAGDAATQLLQQAVLRAVDQAADGHYFPQHLEAGLSPWRVSKVVQARPAGKQGTIRQQPFEVLQQLGTTLDVASAEVVACLNRDPDELTQVRSFEVVQAIPGASTQSIFADLNIGWGSDARRERTPQASIDFDKLVEQAKLRQRISAMTTSLMQRPDEGAQLLGQVKQLLAPLSRPHAARQMAELARRYRQSEQWELCEAMYAELITYYADQPEAVEAMQWLMTFWTSTELNWQRLRTMEAAHSTNDILPSEAQAIAQANYDRAVRILDNSATKGGAQAEIEQLSSSKFETSQIANSVGDLGSVFGNGPRAGNQRLMRLVRWREMAVAVADQLATKYPRLFEEPELQFSVAALHRQRNQSQRADEVYDQFLQLLNDDPYYTAARGEVYLRHPTAISPKPVLTCARVQKAPVLDGVLSDAMWANASELRLSEQVALENFVGLKGERHERTAGEPIVMLAHDERFLYIAARVPVHPDLPDTPPSHGGREHDADVRFHDHLKFQFDVDRDYKTFYEFSIDQRGQCAERCWDATGYNPQWYLATIRQEQAWQFEAAIPLEDLLPVDTLSRTTWGLGVTRVMPGIGSQSWTNSGAEVPLPAHFGFVRFTD